MLNNLQTKQFAAVRSMLSRNNSELISLELFDAYLEHVDCIKFAESAVLFKRIHYPGAGTAMRMVRLNCSSIDFFRHNRAKLAKFFEGLAEDRRGLLSTETTSLMVVADLASRSATKQDLAVTPHDAGLALYGMKSEGSEFQSIAEMAVVVVAEVAAELFLTVASTIEGESLVERDYFIPEFLNRVKDGDFSRLGLKVAKYTFDSVGAEIFVKNAVNYHPNNNALRKDGKLTNFDYINDYIHFYDFNKSDVISWFNAHIESENRNNLVKEDLLNSVYKLIENLGLNSYDNQPIVSLHEIAAIIYGNNNDNSVGYHVVAKALMILVVEQLSLEYQTYYNYLYQ